VPKRKPLRLFSAVWGDKHLDWFEKCCLESLSWEKNAEAIEGATWSFLTKAKDRERLIESVKASGIKIRDVDFMVLGPDFDQNPHAAGQFMNEGFVMEISKCITYGAQSLTAPPDTVFGNGTIKSLVAVGSQRDVVVFAAHMRVLPEILDGIRDYQVLTQKNPSNAKLVSLAIRHAHRTWTEAEVGLEKINSYVGGISWRYLDENLYAVTHRLPTPYLINFTPEDLVYFRNQIHYGVIDHSFPGDCLIDSERQRVIGSSDGAFMVELTEAASNIPPTAPYHDDQPDLFWRNAKHNRTNRMNTIILRGE
jgi:hypothetical protein